MRHAASQQANGFHFLCQAHLLFQNGFPGDIALHGDVTGDPSFIIANGIDENFGLKLPAITSTGNEASAPTAEEGDVRGYFIKYKRSLAFPGKGIKMAAHHCLATVAGNALEGGVHILNHAMAIDVDDDIG